MFCQWLLCSPWPDLGGLFTLTTCPFRMPRSFSPLSRWLCISALVLVLCAFVFLLGCNQGKCKLAWSPTPALRFCAFFKICIFRSSERTLTFGSLGLFPPTGPSLTGSSMGSPSRSGHILFTQFFHSSDINYRLSSSPLFLLSHFLVDLPQSSSVLFFNFFINAIGFSQLFIYRSLPLSSPQWGTADWN